MKLRSYFNPNADANMMRTVQIRLQSDAAPAAPFVLLGDINHEVPDNASGMQQQAVSHVIYQHVQELLYREQGIQDMQRIKLTHAGGFVLVQRVFVDRGDPRVGIGHTSTIKVTFEPANATHDPVQFMVSNPGLIEVISNTGNGELTFKNLAKGELFIQVKTNGYSQNFPYEFDEKLPPAVEEPEPEPEEPEDP